MFFKKEILERDQNLALFILQTIYKVIFDLALFILQTIHKVIFDLFVKVDLSKAYETIAKKKFLLFKNEVL